MPSTHCYAAVVVSGLARDGYRFDSGQGRWFVLIQGKQMESRARAACCLIAAFCAGCWSASSPLGGVAGTDADIDGDADADADGDNDADTEADADTDTYTEVTCGDDGPCSGAGLICNENWGICVVANCAGQDDFTPCEIVTAPDRSFDICVDGICVSPGCGNAGCNTPSPHFPLPDTNQRTCFNDTSVVACPTEGEDFYGQDAQFGWDLEHPVGQRYARDLSVPGEPVVMDNVAGLVWQGCSYGLGGDGCTSGSAVMSDWIAQVANCDALDWGGHDDWRLPDPYELSTLLNRGKNLSPHIDEAAFPATANAPYLYHYWTSATATSDTGSFSAVVVDFGSIVSVGVYQQPKSSHMYARCVRGGPLKARKLVLHVDLGDRVIVDSLTGLQWQGCAHGQAGGTCGIGNGIPVAWAEALDYCENQFWGGHDDWRLPDAVELQSLVSYRLAIPAIDTVLFPSALNKPFWSSSSLASDPADAWLVQFSDGGVSGTAFGVGKTSSSSVYVRCVRGGQWD
jgi:hypothetical protein